METRTGTDGMGPLAGVPVVDLSRALSGPYATMMLADAGAEALKVERPGGATTPAGGAHRSSATRTRSPPTTCRSTVRSRRSPWTSRTTTRS